MSQEFPNVFSPVKVKQIQSQMENVLAPTIKIYIKELCPSVTPVDENVAPSNTTTTQNSKKNKKKKNNNKRKNKKLVIEETSTSVPQAEAPAKSIEVEVSSDEDQYPMSNISDEDLSSESIITEHIPRTDEYNSRSQWTEISEPIKYRSIEEVFEVEPTACSFSTEVNGDDVACIENTGEVSSCGCG